MFSSQINRRISQIAPLASVLAVAAFGSTADAASIIAWGHSASRDAVHFQFSTDQPFYAVRARVRANTDSDAAIETVLGGPWVTPGASSAARFVGGLHPNRPGTLYVYIQWSPGGTWDLERTEPFSTLP